MKKNLFFTEKKFSSVFTGLLLLIFVSMMAVSCSKEDAVMPGSASPEQIINPGDAATPVPFNIPPPVDPVIPSNALIYISHGGCNGACPQYSVVIERNGDVFLTGIRNVVADETQPYKISPEEALNLADMLVSRGFFELQDYYPYNVRYPINVTAVQLDEVHSKVVVDCGIGVPEWLGITREYVEAVLGIDKNQDRAY